MIESAYYSCRSEFSSHGGSQLPIIPALHGSGAPVLYEQHAYMHAHMHMLCCVIKKLKKAIMVSLQKKADKQILFRNDGLVSLLLFFICWFFIKKETQNHNWASRWEGEH